MHAKGLTPILNVSDLGQKLGWKLQLSLIAEAPEVFLPVAGGWGRQGATHIRLAEATPQQLIKGLQLAWNLRAQKDDSQVKRKTRR